MEPESGLLRPAKSSNLFVIVLVLLTGTSAPLLKYFVARITEKHTKATILNMQDQEKKVIEERWEIIPGYPNYVVSNLGEIVNSKNQVLAGSLSKNGSYVKVNLSKNGVKKTVAIHRVVAERFLEGYEEAREVLHISTDVWDNSVGNLKVGGFKSPGGGR